MAVALFVLFVVLPLVELYVIVTMAGLIGAFPALVLLLTVSLLGVLLVKHQGTGVWGRTRRTLERGEMPAAEMVDGGLLVAAGAMLIVPGFVTDIIGLLLLVPPVRSLFRNRLLLRWSAGSTLGRSPGSGFIDVEYLGDVTPPPPRTGMAPPELGPGR